LQKKRIQNEILQMGDKKYVLTRWPDWKDLPHPVHICKCGYHPMQMTTEKLILGWALGQKNRNALHPK
jgi:hypothetical protein